MIKNKQLKKLLLFLVLFSSFCVIAQNQNVTGVLQDNLGYPISGATISIKGTSASTISDAQGKFKIVSEKENDVLSVSFMGMKTKIIPLSGIILVFIPIK